MDLGRINTNTNKVIRCYASSKRQHIKNILVLMDPPQINNNATHYRQPLAKQPYNITKIQEQITNSKETKHMNGDKRITISQVKN